MATLISASLDVTKITKARTEDGVITLAEKEDKKEEKKVEEKQEDLPF